MRKNTSGATDPKNYLIGKGRLFFASHLTNGRPGPYEFLGNCPDFSLSLEPETYEHFSSQAGIRTKDLEIVIEQNLESSFTLEEAHIGNLKRFLSGSTSAMAVGTAAGTTTATVMGGEAGAGKIKAGMWYSLVKLVGTTETRYPGIQSAADLTLTFLDDATPVSLVLGTDYEVDLKFGRVFLKPESAKVITAVAASDHALQFEIDANVAAPSTVNALDALTTTQVRGALMFISENANSTAGDLGAQSEIHLWNVNLVPSGDFGLISDEAAQMQFNASATPSVATGKSCTIITPDYAD